MQRGAIHRRPRTPAPLRGPLYPYPHRLATYPPSPTDWAPLRRPLPSPTDWMATHWPHRGLAYPYPTTYPTSPLDGQRGATPLPGHPALTLRCLPPHLPTGGKGGGTGHLWPKGCGFFFRTYPHYPFGVGGRAFRPASLKHFSHTNCPAKTITEKSYLRGFFVLFWGLG